MKRINLKDYYPHYKTDYYVDVYNELAAALHSFEKREKAYKEKERYHKAYYSLERAEGIGRCIKYTSVSPEEIYERKLTKEELYSAMNKLSDVQARRIYAYYFLGMKKSEIADAEGTERPAITKSIERGLNRLGKYIKRMDD